MYDRKYKEGKAPPTTPATAKQEPKKKPSPLGEGGRREPDGRGELALINRLLHNLATKPNSPCK